MVKGWFSGGNVVLPGGRNSGLRYRLLGSQALGLFHVFMSGVEKG